MERSHPGPVQGSRYSPARMGSLLQGRLESEQPPDAEPRCAVGLLRSTLGKERTDGNIARRRRWTLRDLREKLRRLDGTRNARRFERAHLRGTQHKESQLESLSARLEQL